MNDKPETKSRIVIEFESTGSSEPNLTVDNVTPMQIIAAGRVVQMLGERQLHQVWYAQEMQRKKRQIELAGIQQVIKGKKLQ